MNDNKLKETPIIKKRTLKSFFKDGFAGILLGLAVILPGISGSTIAILFKIYDKILYSVSGVQIGDVLKAGQEAQMQFTAIYTGGVAKGETYSKDMSVSIDYEQAWF